MIYSRISSPNPVVGFSTGRSYPGLVQDDQR